jgi:formylglycine-generating enzyme required for sulfatase activity
MRSDFLGDCSQFPGLPEALNRSQYLIPRMTREQVRDAIEKPLRLVGARMGGKLVERLLNELGDDTGQLPVLQHALNRTFREFEKKGGTGEIGIDDYAAAGELKGALNAHAESLLDSQLQRWTERVFRCLTTVEGGRKLRRPTRLDRIFEIVGARDEGSRKLVTQVIERYSHPDHAMLVWSGKELTGGSVVDISHESLIEHWTRLKDWVTAEADAASLYLSAAEDAVRNRRGAAASWRSLKLSEAVGYLEQGPWNEAWAKRTGFEGARFEEVKAFLEREASAQRAEQDEKELRQARELAAQRRATDDAEARARAEQQAKDAAVSLAAAERAAKENAEARAAAERSAKEDAEARARAEGRAKEAAQSLAVAEREAKENAEARAAAERGAKEDAEARARAEGQAKEAAQSLASAEREAKENAEARATAEQREKGVAQTLALTERKAKLAAESLAAAERSAKEDAEARALAEQRAKEAAESLAAAEREAKESAEARAAAEQRAKQAAEDLARVERKAKRWVFAAAVLALVALGLVGWQQYSIRTALETQRKLTAATDLTATLRQHISDSDELLKKYVSQIYELRDEITRAKTPAERNQLQSRLNDLVNQEGQVRKQRDSSAVALTSDAKSGTRINPLDGLPYVFIPAGAFVMGCSPGDTECFADEKPSHAVQIADGFWLGQTEVTQAAWKKVYGGDSPSRFKGDQLPVEQVDWNQAGAYCKKIGGRLPTEKEWEYAARAGTAGPRYGDLDAIAWYSGNSGGTTHPVGSKQANAFGLYDMLGNVWEWVADDWAAYPGGSADACAGCRVVRGGSWLDFTRYVRASDRYRLVPTERNDDFGFRCVGEFR